MNNIQSFNDSEVFNHFYGDGVSFQNFFEIYKEAYYMNIK